ncbi:uracil-DNA glycosylase-like [Mya arenaria]|uniref:uracil-DNA glycosylase-like n=1 Tax=Mya arenaria TaxID=6604 RepID=UPI0022E7F047|nr:uracil-DNA glycosylase-like [Mya arenaria]
MASKLPNTLLVNVGESWRPFLEAEFSKPYFAQLTQFVCAERKNFNVYPSEENVFSWTRACSFEQVEYIEGLAFSVPTNVTPPPPPSLVNIFNELEQDIPSFRRPAHGYLQGWAEQGVLMLNSVLTVREGVEASHTGKGWEQFTDAVIAYLNNNKNGLVFVMWGLYAQKKAARIDKVVSHRILTSSLPSPNSAHLGFSGCRHFSQINAYLQKNGIDPINWSYLPPFQPRLVDHKILV